MSDVEALLARVAHLENLEAARALSIRYAKALDQLDLAALESLFVPNAVLEIPDQRFAGRDAVMGFFREALTTGPKVDKRHFMTNHEYETTPTGEIGMRSYFVYTIRGEATSVIGWGRYVDVVIVDEGQARFGYKSIEIDLQTDVREGWATP